jgi:molybdenum cofactor synthesis domain-containing protein
MSQSQRLTPAAALTLLQAEVRQVASESLPLDRAAGRYLAAPINADRDSPAMDVSAMDGYAARVSDLDRDEPLAVAATCRPGMEPPAAPPPGSVVRLFTGSSIPRGLELVIRREDVHETATEIRWLPAARTAQAGRDIRFRGENARAGENVIPAGTRLTAGVIAAAATFGAVEVSAARKVVVAILTTGDELLALHQVPEPWQIRDSNGPMLAGLLANRPEIHVLAQRRAADQLDLVISDIAAALREADLVLITGGASKGDRDYVPEAVQRCGARIIFHRLPQRPGQPLLGAVGPQGQCILGLPGNPASALLGAIRYGLPMITHMSGGPSLAPPMVTIDRPDDRSLDLWWFRPVRLLAQGRAELVTTRGSGDIASLAKADGLVEVPPGTVGAGPFSFWSY